MPLASTPSPSRGCAPTDNVLVLRPLQRCRLVGTFQTSGLACRRPLSEEHQTRAGTRGKIPWRDVGFQVASRHGGTTCDPKQRCGNSLACRGSRAVKTLKAIRCNTSHWTSFRLPSGTAPRSVLCSAVLVLKKCQRRFTRQPAAWTDLFLAARVLVHNEQSK
jgi:hypothetical protein